MDNLINSIAILGGTGKEGIGLAYRWAKKGYRIIIGSRQLQKAELAVKTLLELIPGAAISAETNQVAVEKSDLIVLTVPYNVHQEFLSALKDQLQGKILVDVTVPLVPPKVSRVQMPAAGSAAMEAQLILGEAVRVVSAFQNISYENLMKDEPLHCDVLVTGNSSSAKKVILQLVKDAGMVGWDAGPLENSMVAEGLTSILIGINRQFGVHSSGIKITGVNREDVL